MKTITAKTRKERLSNSYLSSRYFRFVAKAIQNANPDAYVYHTGSEGLEFALQYCVAKNHEEAISELASREDVSIEDITNNYSNWYYIMPISEIVSNLTHDVIYYHPVLKGHTNPYTIKDIEF